MPLLKRYFNTGVFLWNLRKFYKHLFLQSTSSGCFWLAKGYFCVFKTKIILIYLCHVTNTNREISKKCLTFPNDLGCWFHSLIFRSAVISFIVQSKKFIKASLISRKHKNKEWRCLVLVLLIPVKTIFLTLEDLFVSWTNLKDL